MVLRTFCVTPYLGKVIPVADRVLEIHVLLRRLVATNRSDEHAAMARVPAQIELHAGQRTGNETPAHKYSISGDSPKPV
jgi:hypothetical protein